MFEDRGADWQTQIASEADRDAAEELINAAHHDGLLSGSEFNRIYFNLRAAETLGDLDQCLQRIPKQGS